VDIAARLQQLDEMVREAKSMPLSSSALVNREEMLGLIAETQGSLPDEIKQARWIVKDREELLAKARGDGERIVEQAREEQLRMARREEIARRAKEEADRMLAESKDRAEQMKGEAEDYVDAKLAQFEIALRKVLEEAQGTARAIAKTLDQVEAGRERLRTPGTVADQEFRPKAQARLYDDEAQA
jgi:F0F1-type ATP synthase membrane subunit b/b'